MPCTGCRSLTSGQTNRPLVTARQLSLRGADALQRERYQDAELLFSQSLAQSSLDERAHWGYAMTLWNRGDKQRATFHMSEALRLSGRNPEYAVRLGEMYLELGRIEDAKNMALDVLSGNRNHAQAWALLGDTHRAERDWDNSMECYHRALLIRADYPKVQLAVAELYRLRGRPERALSTLDRMTDLNANIAEDPNHMLLRGMTFADLQRNQEAAVLLASGSERLPPDQWRRQLEVAETQFRLGELVDARLTLGRIPEPSSQDPAVTAFRDKLDASFQQWAATHPGELPTNLQARIMNSSDASAGNPNFAGPNAPGFRIAAQAPLPPAANGPKAPAARGTSLPEPKSLRALHAGFPKTGQQP